MLQHWSHGLATGAAQIGTGYVEFSLSPLYGHLSVAKIRENAESGDLASDFAMFIASIGSAIVVQLM